MGSPCSQREPLLTHHENDPFLKRIITGDEKWVVYNNVKRKRSWRKKDEPAQTISKADIHQKKMAAPVSESAKRGMVQDSPN
ncbi:histone-lysine N-methyltransferase SETMAR [Trichonephila clavipes]|nr:histone-lysine N-methyltransferase SETMAR [Trichonephila clavipes]